MNLLTMKHITKAYTDKILLEDADFSLEEGEKVGLIGLNGTGKSTLLKIIAGRESCEKGELTKGSRVMVNYLAQNPQFPEGMTIYEYVIKANTTPENEWSIEGEAKTMLNRLGFTDYSQVIDNLSGGQKKKVALAGALLSRKEILILDEPTNHLDNRMTEWLEVWLREYRGAVVMVTHDRYFLDLVCSRIVEINRGKLYSYNTNYEGYLQLKAQREAAAASTEKKHANLLRKEIAWIQRGARARSTKQKAHIARYEALRDEEKVTADERVEISAVSSRLGKKTIELIRVSKGYGNRTLVRNFTYTFLRTDRVGILGPNGCGKTTLMKLITGREMPDDGRVEIGETVKIGYYAQEAEHMEETCRVIDYIRDTAEYIRTEDGTITASQMLEKFLFEGALQYARIGSLSGGERRRLYLAKVLMEAPNVLILDEPTNDLDISTLCVLEDYLDTFAGIVITVSHDRYFLDRVARRMLTFEADGQITLYNGSYTDYFREKGERLWGETEQCAQLHDTGRTDRQTQKSVSALEQADGMAGILRAERKDGAQEWKEQKARSRKLKFTYKEQKEYETIETDIAALEAKLTELEGEMSRAATDFVKLGRLAHEKEETENRLEEKLERFVYLTELAEKIASQGHDGKNDSG